MTSFASVSCIFLTVPPPFKPATCLSWTTGRCLGAAVAAAPDSASCRAGAEFFAATRTRFLVHTAEFFDGTRFDRFKQKATVLMNTFAQFKLLLVEANDKQRPE